MHGVIFVLEMAAGQLWRFVVDGWASAALGQVAAVAVIFRRGVRDETRIIGRARGGITLVTAVVSPADCPPTSRKPRPPALPRRHAGRVFLVRAAVLLRADRRRIIVYAACVIPPTC